jgi:galactokinase
MADTSTVPTATSLTEIYPDEAIPAQTKRWESLLSAFEARYGHRADFVSRSPGRVNLIGEHIDYMLYEVFPMAITADVLLAVAVPPPSTEATAPAKFRIANVLEQFGPLEFEIEADGNVHVDPANHDWGNYFKAGVRGVIELLRERFGKFSAVGMDVMMDGTVPAGSGLSSSTAFVCASALATLAANGEKTINKTQFTELAITTERSVGVNSGGMDQTASICSLRGSATYVSFVPKLTATPVAFPSTDPDFSFVIAQSYVTSLKAMSGPINYNRRVVECTLAAQFLAKAFGLKDGLNPDRSPLGISLRGFQDAYFKEKHGVEDNYKTTIQDFQSQLEKLVNIVDEYIIQEDGYTREQIGDLLGISIDDLNERYMGRFPVQAEHFKLRQRALHVYGEALRVLKFRALLAAPPKDGSGDAVLKELGDLMNEAQASARDYYECSCPELEELCELARSAGAYGSRLSGAGWGGASVHLVPKHRVEAVRQAWIDNYYHKRWPDMTEEKFAEAIVVSEPGSGSYLFKVTRDKVA